MKRLLLPLVLLLSACPGARTTAVVAPKPPPVAATDEGPVVWQKSKSGVGFRLSDADPEPPPRPKRAAAKPLSPADTARVLARLAPMKASAEEKSFALRDRSRPAPRPGETITSAFPPPVAPAGPPPAPATAAAPSLVRWAPEGAIEVAPHVSLTFSEPMVPVTSHGELAASAVPARINPQPEGKWRWIGTQTLLFEPKDERFPKATDYTVEIPAGTRTISGRTLDKAYNFGFKLPAVSIEQFHPQDYRTVELEPLLFARFDQRVRQKDVLAHILMKPADGRKDTPPIALRLATADEIEADEAVRRLVQLTEPERFIAFRAVAPLPKATRFEIRFERLPSAEGPKTPDSDSGYHIRTYGPLKLSSLDCGWSEGCAPLAPWVARFTNPIDPAGFDESLVTIYPPLPGARFSLSGETIAIRGRSKGRSKYKVRFGQALRDKFGQTLESAAEAEVEIDAAEPMLFPEERTMVVLDPAFAPALNVYSVNRNNLRVRLYAVEPGDYRAYVKFRQDWDYDGKLTNPPGRLIATRNLQPKKAPDELTETPIELGSVLKDGAGQLIAVVEPPVQKPPRDRWDRQREWVRTWIQVTKLGLMTFVDPSGVHGWVSRLADGAAVPNAEFGLLGTSGLRGPNSPSRTGPDGMAQSAVTGTGQIPFARSGSDLVFLTEDVRYSQWRRSDALRWFVFDDRTLYKPGERVHVKGWLRIATAGKNGDIARLPAGGHRVDFNVTDARGSKIAESKTDVDSDGGFTLAFDVPKNANLGRGGVNLKLSGPARGFVNDGHTHGFRIEEFRRPEFEVSAETTEGPHFVGKHAIATVRATYYAGGSLPDSDVKWRVQGEDGFFSPPNRRAYNFGKPQRFSFWRPDNDEEKRKADENWEARTHAGGQHRLRLDFDALEPAYPRKLDLEATITDVNRQSWTARANLLVHPANVTVGLRAESTLPTAGQNLLIDALVTDLDGKAVAGRPVSVTCARVENSWHNDKLVQKTLDATTCNLSSDGAETAQRCTFATKEGGLHRVTAVVTDVHGRKSNSEMDVWVIGRDSTREAGVRAGHVELVPDKSEYASSDEVKLLVLAPFAPAEGVLTLEREGVVELRRFRLEQRMQTISTRLVPAWLPGVQASVHLVGAAVRENESGEPDPSLPKRPAFAHGSAKLEIATAERTLKVTVAPQVKALDPGGSTTIALGVTDARGQAAANASVALVVVDESVLALAGYSLPDPLGVFYLARAPDVSNFETHDMVVLGKPDLSRMTLEPKKKFKAKPEGGLGGLGMSGRAAGGSGQGYGSGSAKMVSRSARMSAAPMASAAAEMSMDAKPGARRDLAKKESDVEGNEAEKPGTPIAVRTNFSALAAFVPRLVTDARGQAQAKIKLPDSLTRYRVVAVAAANENQFGVGESDMTARLPLMVRPSPPRFMNFGDRAQLPVVIQNQTAEPINVDVALRVANLNLLDPNGQRVTVPAADRVELRFPVAARSAGTARIQLGASGRGQSGRSLADAAELELPVWTPATTEAFATYGVIDQGAVAQSVKMPSNVVTEFGALELTTSSTALQGLSDALLYLVRYPFECNEQLSSRVLSIAALRDVLTAFEAEGLPPPSALKQTIALDVQKLADRQHYSGGWDYWRRDREPDPYVSVHVTNALYRAKSKGYKVPENTFTGALNFLRNIRQRFPPYWPPEARRVVESYAVNVRFRAGDPDPARARALIAEAGGPEKLGIEAIGWLLPVLSKDPASAAQLEAVRRHLDNRVAETAGKAHFVTSYGDNAHLLLHSDRRTDGVLLDAFIDDRPNSDLIPKLVAGLLAQRKRGRWYNTQENVFILLGLDRYFQTYEKATPDFVARAWLGDRFAAEHLFRGRSNDRKHVEVPLAALSELIPPGKTATATLSKEGTGRLYYRLGMQYALSDLRPPAAEHGFTVARVYESVDAPSDVRRDPDGTWRVKAGSLVRVRLTMVAPGRRYHVALVDPLPAGLEPLNPALATTQSIPRDPEDDPSSPEAQRGAKGTSRGRGARGSMPWWWSRAWYEHQNLRDERVEAFASLLWDGVYSYTYVARATTPGEFVVPPAKAEEMYDPETFGRSAGDRVTVY